VHFQGVVGYGFKKNQIKFFVEWKQVEWLKCGYFVRSIRIIAENLEYIMNAAINIIS
jgi:hypothetical protein